jgi:hypothetical protein
MIHKLALRIFRTVKLNTFHKLLNHHHHARQTVAPLQNCGCTVKRANGISEIERKADLNG